ncbi:arylsulfatase [Shewanella sp. 1_MG-2023]|uniref:Arylsulfatase n=1 Tax=Shewanella electrodiphila TaxID=934143 RepID=A0ABT0KJ41_9GAMM|nr:MULTISPECIES: arylsulfatase [Shewanella]MCC4831367.1 arylsulfatase [Shewanella sp. 10N.7]MCL1043852.1 arylsulfatase [Shewanella electrodiphila]MDO6609857.1 arylsulfatase [Shewanella sp. 7_MG-2023]MDO6770001.1 arylsulfatase [Shewanella sp. 2_MG-2023]MDO6793065.1 arylsulfatase [Shewanella sp. 1_MG-2023]
MASFFNTSKIALCTGLLAASSVANAADKPNILAIWGDDIGIFNISAYNNGMMGYQTPNIDRIANEGALFTDHYAQQSCTAGRSAFLTGQEPFRTGLLTIGMPGSDAGIPDWTPTIADVLKEQGYMTAQFGKNHMGDQDKHLPTAHGFDEFFGNLYHLNAEEEPETYYYPKDPEFRKKYGPRGVIRSSADGKIEDTGPMTRKRMEHADEEFLEESLAFMEKAVKAEKPFFIWHNTTRMHVWTRLQEKYQGISGISIYADGMIEHDDHVGILLDKLDSLGVADNTIVLYTTDNGAETVSWPDGGATYFHGEKGTTFEGGMRVPQLVRWPGVIKPGTKINDIMSHKDWLPTFAAVAGDDKVIEKLKSDKGARYNGTNWRVHLDGYNFKPYFEGKVDKGPRDGMLYFSANAELNAVRTGDFKVSFATLEGNIVDAVRFQSNWPQVVHLRADPFEKAPHESGMYLRWMADNMWLFVPVGNQVQEFMATLKDYPRQESQVLNPGNINQNTYMLQGKLQQIEQIRQKVLK